MRFLLASLLLCACTSIENDKSTNNWLSLVQTQIDFQPPSREERINRIGAEEELYKRDSKPILAKLEELEASRAVLYKEVEDEFPKCQKQKHCISQMVQQDVKKFERYNEITIGLREIDRKLIDAEADLAALTFRKNQRVRAVYNRYLVHEFLRLPTQNRSILELRAHSLEVFKSKRSLAYRLLRFADDAYVPNMVGDFDFQMLGHPIDEAAILATFDITVRDFRDLGKKPSRFLVTFLVNTHQLDPQAYEKTFFSEWGNLLVEEDRVSLRKSVFCAPYSIASPILAPKLSSAKMKPCAEARVKMQSKKGAAWELLDSRNWMLPIAYFRFPE